MAGGRGQADGGAAGGVDSSGVEGRHVLRWAPWPGDLLRRGSFVCSCGWDFGAHATTAAAHIRHERALPPPYRGDASYDSWQRQCFVRVGGEWFSVPPVPEPFRGRAELQEDVT